MLVIPLPKLVNKEELKTYKLRPCIQGHDYITFNIHVNMTYRQLSLPCSSQVTCMHYICNSVDKAMVLAAGFMTHSSTRVDKWMQNKFPFDRININSVIYNLFSTIDEIQRGPYDNAVVSSAKLLDLKFSLRG